MSEAIITFKNVSKTYILYKNDQARFKALFFKPRNPKTNKALNDVSFEIYRGESVGIVGDNGAGKSTLLKMITGVAFPDEGEIIVNGKVAALLELTAGFSMEMTGRENIYLKGYILGLEDAYIKQIEERIIDFAELGDYIDQPVRTYSSGMKMRLGRRRELQEKVQGQNQGDNLGRHYGSLRKPQRRIRPRDLSALDLPEKRHRYF